MSKARTKAHSYLTRTGSNSLTMAHRGVFDSLPAGAKDLPEPSLKQMFDENRKQRRRLLKIRNKTPRDKHLLAKCRARAKWIKHEMRNAVYNA